MTTIRTRYTTHPGSNVGSIRATAHGMRVTVRVNQAWPMIGNHYAAAVKLADRLGAVVSVRETATNAGYRWETLTAWSSDEARELRATARRMFRDHGHPFPIPFPDDADDDARDMDAYADEVRMTRENCGACVLGGYADGTDDGRANLQPNYAGWERLYIQAGKAIPTKYHPAMWDALGPDAAADNAPFADALRRDILTFGGWQLNA